MMFAKKIILLSLCSLAFFCSCGDDDNAEVRPFQMGSSNYEMKVNSQFPINVASGNGSYTLSVSNPGAMTATVASSNSDVPVSEYGTILVSCNQKGTYSLTVTDNKTSDKQTVTVKVVDDYLSCYFTESNSDLLPTGSNLFLVKNTAKDFYIYTNANTSTPTATGTYEVFNLGVSYYLKLTPNGEAAHSLYLNESDKLVFNYFINYFDAAAKTRASEGDHYLSNYLVLTEQWNSQLIKIQGLVGGSAIPQGVLN